MSKNTIVLQAWKAISPVWPLKHFVASNPLNSYVGNDFEAALKMYADEYLVDKKIPEKLRHVNKENIKWCQTFFDQGQAKICLKWRDSGFYYACKKFFVYDELIHQGKSENLNFIKKLPDSSENAIKNILNFFQIEERDQLKFLKLVLTTLPGWAAHAKYLFEWSEKKDLFKGLPADYLAVRLVVLKCLWPEAKLIMNLSVNENLENNFLEKKIETIKSHEKNIEQGFLKKISSQKKIDSNFNSKIQIVFCIDVRCERFRRNLEKLGNYQTFGAAGFYNLPIKIKDEVNLTEYSSCPVFLKADETVCLKNESKNFVNIFKQVYQSLKYNFITPFALVESLGLCIFFILFFKTFLPKSFFDFRSGLISYFSNEKKITIDSSLILLEKKIDYAVAFLKSIDLIENFGDMIILSGHESKSENNAFFSSLDCGACGGNSGKINAQVMCEILNNNLVRKKLAQKFNIKIPEQTLFLAAVYNTTTESFEVLDSEKIKDEQFFRDLKQAELSSNKEKMIVINAKQKGFFGSSGTDWSQVRPELGLAGNTFFIVGPRKKTKNINLQGQAFLHSYNYENDLDGKILKQILRGPVSVAHQINMQYFYSTLNNNFFGSGNKVTQNFVGRIGVIKGNSSDLKIGLSWQSLFLKADKSFFTPSRLNLVIFAPKNFVDKVLQDEVNIKNLIDKKWLNLTFLCESVNNI